MSKPDWIPPREWIEWDDSCGAADVWEFRDDMDPLLPARCITVGFVMDETDTYVTIASTVAEVQVLGRLTIPKVAIVRRRSIR